MTRWRSGGSDANLSLHPHRPVIDDYFGTPVADPCRWLEDPNSPETPAWVDAQNAVTSAFLARIPARERIRARLTVLWD